MGLDQAASAEKCERQRYDVRQRFPTCGAGTTTYNSYTSSQTVNNIHVIPLYWIKTTAMCMALFTLAFIGSFAKLRKATISYLMSVSLRPHEHLGSHWTDFHEIWYLSNFRNSVQKIQVSLKSDKNNGYFTWIPMYIYDNISLNSS
jgi:hypothetical protein